MNRFAPVLQKARDQLRVPEPTRTRILLEMAADLEDSYQFYLSRGHDEAEASRRAEEAFGSSDEALKHLARIHESGVGGIGDRISGQVGRIWEKVLLLVVLIFEAWFAINVLTQKGFFLFLSPFVWPIAGLALAALSVTIWKLYQVFSGSGSDVRQLRTGLGVLLFCAGASLAVAGCGFLFHMQRFFRVNWRQAPEALYMNFAGWMMEISSMMTVGLLTAIFIALVWFVLSNLVKRAELREIEALLEARV
jgi:hypothetical protein